MFSDMLKNSENPTDGNRVDLPTRYGILFDYKIQEFVNLATLLLQIDRTLLLENVRSICVFVAGVDYLEIDLDFQEKIKQVISSLESVITYSGTPTYNLPNITMTDMLKDRSTALYYTTIKSCIFYCLYTTPVENLLYVNYVSKYKNFKMTRFACQGKFRYTKSCNVLDMGNETFYASISKYTTTGQHVICDVQGSGLSAVFTLKNSLDEIEMQEFTEMITQNCLSCTQRNIIFSYDIQIPSFDEFFIWECLTMGKFNNKMIVSDKDYLGKTDKTTRHLEFHVSYRIFSFSKSDKERFVINTRSSKKTIDTIDMWFFVVLFHNFKNDFNTRLPNTRKEYDSFTTLKIDKKINITKQLLSPLQQAEPKLFGTKLYSTTCQLSHQPYIIKAPEIEMGGMPSHWKKMMTQVDWNNAFVLTYPVDMTNTVAIKQRNYACVPRRGYAMMGVDKVMNRWLPEFRTSVGNKLIV